MRSPRVRGSIILLTVGYTDLVHVQEICGSMTTADLVGFGQMQTITPFSTLILTRVGFGSTKLVLIGSFIILFPTFGRLIASQCKCSRYALGAVFGTLLF